MKKLLSFVIASVIFLLCLAGCGDHGAANTYTKIDQLTVSFDLDEQTFRVVKIDFTGGIKTVKDYTDDSLQENSYDFSDPESLLALLEESVIPALRESSSYTQNSDEQRIRWEIKIVTDAGNLNAWGVGDDPFPDYWQRLLELLGEQTH